MQHDRDRTQIKTGDEYSHGRHIFQDAIRGFVAGTRGWLEGRKLQRDARTDREKRIADEAFRQRTLDLTEQRNKLEELRYQQGADTAESERLRQEGLDKIAEEKRNAEEAKEKAIKDLGDQYDKETQAYFDEREKYNAETDPVKKQEFRSSLIRRGSWLESHAEQVGRKFDSHTRFIESDAEMREEALAKQQKATELERKQKAIQDSTVLTPEQKTVALDQLAIDPDYNILESIEKERAAAAEQTEETAETAATEAKKQEIRDAKHKLLDQHSGYIKDNHGQPVLDALRIAVESVDDPNDVDLLEYLGPVKVTGATDKKADPDIIAVTADISDEGMRESISRVSANSTFSTPAKKVDWAKQVKNELSLGNRGIALRMLGDKVRDITKTIDKFMASRLPIAKQLVDIRTGIYELSDMGVSTGRVLSKYVETMSQAEFHAAAKEAVIDFSGIENLTGEQKTKATAVATQINASLALLLQKVSGAAVQETEFERWRGMLPALFKSEEINIGTVDGFLTVLRSDQEANYAQYVNADIAKEIIADEGWGEIKTSEDYRKEATERNKGWQTKPQADKLALTAALIDTFKTREKAIARLMSFYGITVEDAGKLIDEFDKLDDAGKKNAREAAEKMKNE